MKNPFVFHFITESLEAEKTQNLIFHVRQYSFTSISIHLSSLQFCAHELDKALLINGQYVYSHVQYTEYFKTKQNSSLIIIIDRQKRQQQQEIIRYHFFGARTNTTSVIPNW